MLSVQDLLTINKVPDVEEVSLQTITAFYEEHLCGHQFYYELRHAQRELRIRFKIGDLCHLLGLQHVLSGRQNVGEPGFQKLKSGTNTFKTLENANIGGYEDMIYRILYFPFVYQLIQNPQVVVNDPHNGNMVNAQFSFYNNYTQHFVELKLRREGKENPNFFIPVSFAESRKIRPRNHVTIQEKKILGYNDGYITQHEIAKSQSAAARQD